MRIFLTFSFFLLFGVGIKAQKIYIVNTVNDIDDGLCDNMHCSLREAINAANIDGFKSVIWFEINGQGLKKITLNEELPTITSNNLLIEGTTLAQNYPTQGRLIIDGQKQINNGFSIQSSDVTIYGLQIQNFIDNAINIQNPQQDTIRQVKIGGRKQGNIIINNGNAVFAEKISQFIFQSNYVGTNLNFEQGLGNINGIIIENDWNSYDDAEIVIGGSIEQKEYNFFASSSESAIDIIYHGFAKIEGNFFGTALNGDEQLGNKNGIIASNRRGRIDIGGSEDTKNIFAYNENAVVVDRNNFVRASENSFYCNVLGLVVVENPHPTPVIQSGVETILVGTAQPSDFVEIYLSDSQTPCKNGDCQGMRYLGVIQANSEGAWQFPGNFLFGEQFVALARNNGRQSMFSECYRVCPSSIQPRATNSGPYCDNESIELDANSDIYGYQWVTPFYGQEIIYEWTGPNGFYSEEENPLNVTDTGAYVLQAYFYGCPSLLDTTFVEITQLSVSIDEIPIQCQADSIRLNSLVASNVSDLSYQWTGPNNFESIEQNPINILESGTYNLVVSGGGCQSEMLSVEVTNLFPETFSLGENKLICSGETISLNISNQNFYQWSGDFELACDTCPSIEFIPTSDGSIQLIAGINEDCHTTLTLNVDVKEEVIQSEEKILCPGASFNFANQVIDKSGIYSATFIGSNGCDSIHTFLVHKREPISFVEVKSICPGAHIQQNGATYSQSGIYESHFIGANGCDSTYILDLEVLSKTVTEASFSICAGETFLVFDTLVASSYSMTKTFTGSNGCDSLHTISVQMKEHQLTNKNITLCAGESVSIWEENLLVSENGLYEKNYRAINGCDSLVKIQVEVLAPIQTFTFITMCDKEAADILENTNTYPSDYSETFTAKSGCDSIHFVEYSILLSQEVEEYVRLCETESYFIDGQTINESGRYVNNYTGFNGCDSTHIIDLTFLKTNNNFAEFELCEGEAINVFGNLVQESGIFTETFTNQNGCDSTQTITVFVKENQSSTEVLSLCEGASILVFDQIITETQEVVKTFTGANGCDSIHTVRVEMLNVVQTASSVQICESACVNLYGATACTNRVAIMSLTGSNGCDSIHTLRLDLMEVIQTESTIEVCSATCIDLYGATACANKLIVTNFSASIGCDSIHTMHLNLLEAQEVIEEITLCAGDSLVALGATIKTSGEFLGSFTGSNGCDSTYKIIVNFLPPINADFQVQASCINQANGKVTLAIEGGRAPYSLFWEGNNLAGTQNINNLAPGSYYIIIEDNFNCKMEHQIQIESIPEPEIEKAILDITCFGANDGSISLFSDKNLVYSLNNLNPNTEGIFTNLAPSTYELTIKDELGCQYFDNITLVEPAQILVDLPEKLSINLGNSIELVPLITGPNQVNFEWTAIESLSCFDCENPIAAPLKNTKYQLTIYDVNNCESQDEVLVLVETNKGIYTPNVFSPNNDGQNDLFTIQAADGPVEEVESFKIFDRWGNMVYEAHNFQPNDESYGWDGTYKGQIMNNGVFVYFAIVKFVDGTETKVQGDITLTK